jgi:hypothetical protein
MPATSLICTNGRKTLRRRFGAKACVTRIVAEANDRNPFFPVAAVVGTRADCEPPSTWILIGKCLQIEKVIEIPTFNDVAVSCGRKPRRRRWEYLASRRNCCRRHCNPHPRPDVTHSGCAPVRNRSAKWNPRCTPLLLASQPPPRPPLRKLWRAADAGPRSCPAGTASVVH